MKGNISLKKFILQVKKELQQAQQSKDDAFFELTDVELEVSFSLQAKGGAKAKLVVAELGGEGAATQAHKVRMKFSPLAVQESSESEEVESQKPRSGGGGGYIEGARGPVYDKVKGPF